MNHGIIYTITLTAIVSRLCQGAHTFRTQLHQQEDYIPRGNASKSQTIFLDRPAQQKLDIQW